MSAAINWDCFLLCFFLPYSWCFIIKNKNKQTIKPQTQIESYVRANVVVIIKWVASYNKICFFVIKVLAGVLCACICWFLLCVFFFPYYSNIQCFILSYQGNLGSVEVSLCFGVCWFWYFITHLSMFSKTLLEHLLDVKCGSSLFFLCDLSLVSVAVIHRLTWGRAEFGTRRILILFQEGRSFGFKLCFRMVVISSRKTNYFTLIKILSKFGSMPDLFPLSEMLCLQLGILF